jgi:hypothetical protein
MRTGTSHDLFDQLGALEERSYAAWKAGVVEIGALHSS